MEKSPDRLIKSLTEEVRILNNTLVHLLLYLYEKKLLSIKDLERIKQDKKW